MNILKQILFEAVAMLDCYSVEEHSDKCFALKIELNDIIKGLGLMDEYYDTFFRIVVKKESPQLFKDLREKNEK